ncbi:MAG TPA: SDR family NAD(P)-dependent oxidoreductase [Thermodesulfobacteriota bacterium]|nr:SDR family NAD(P)-dependent oxidoreductase [Thermodesulfobacteriota bacterium]
MKTKKVETALIVGGGSGMGRAAALELARQEIRVFAADLDLKAAEETAGLVPAVSSRGEAFQVDVSRSESVSSLFRKLQQRAERLDLLVHTAAILGRTVFIEDMTDDEWRQMMAINLDGVFYCCREAVRWMKPHNSGRIILFSSVASLTPTPGALHYSAAKGGINMLAKTLAQEVSKYNIRVNVIAPGYIETSMLKGLPEGFSDYILKRTPLRRLGDVQEIASLVSFLASPEADFFTGQIFSPNGGLVI